MAKPFINPYSCDSIEKKLENIQSVVNEITIEGETYTAGCGVDIAGNVISAAIDGSSIICEDGVLKAVAASDLTAGCGIEIAGGVVSAVVDNETISCVDGVLVANLPTVPATPNCFKTISVAGQSDVVADSSADTLTLVAGSNVTITTNAGSDSITISASGGGGGGGGGAVDYIRIRGLVVGATTIGATSVTIDNIQVIRGADPRTSPGSSSETLSVGHPYACGMEDNFPVLCDYNLETGAWNVVFPYGLMRGRRPPSSPDITEDDPIFELTLCNDVSGEPTGLSGVWVRNVPAVRIKAEEYMYVHFNCYAPRTSERFFNYMWTPGTAENLQRLLKGLGGYSTASPGQSLGHDGGDIFNQTDGAC